MRRGRLWAVMGLVAGVAFGWFVRPRAFEARRSCGYDRVPVVVAAEDLPAGTVITLDLISQRSMPEQFVTSSSVKPDSVSPLLGQRILVAAQAGDVLRWSDFGRDAFDVKAGSRAVIVDLPPERALSGQLARGDHVDVMAVIPDPIVGPMARTLVEDAEVLGVEGTQVLLRVGAEYAERLMLAQQNAKMTLALRGRADTEVLASNGVSLQELRTGMRAPVIWSCKGPR